MKKSIVLLSILTLLACLLTGCCMSHEWQDATCDAPKICTKCGKTEGEVLEHDWKDATCEDPKTCSRCGVTDGAALGHSWQEATCSKARHCSVCTLTEGKPLAHTVLGGKIIKDVGMLFVGNCSVCGETFEDDGYYGTFDKLPVGQWLTDYILEDGGVIAVSIEFNEDGTYRFIINDEVASGSWKRGGGSFAAGSQFVNLDVKLEGISNVGMYELYGVHIKGEDTNIMEFVLSGGLRIELRRAGTA